MEKQNLPVLKACEHLGSQSAVAQLLGVTPPAVHQWVAGIRPVPPEHACSIEKATGGLFPVEQVLPEANWHRVKDRNWPHPKGRPLIDVSVKEAAAT